MQAIRDVVTLNGEIIEVTDDWYAQNTEGKMQYFGEIFRNYENRELDNLDDSRKVGKNMAKSGILILEDPQEGQIHRQEFFLGEAKILLKYRTEEKKPSPYLLELFRMMF